MVRRGLRALVEEQPGWAVVAEASTGREAVELARQLQPDVVVMDFSMPDLNGLEATRQIRAELPRTQVLMLTMHDTERLVRDVLAAGARGYVLKNDAGGVLIEALAALRQGKPFFTTKVANLVLQGYLEPGKGEETAARELLTPREREIVQLIAEGQSTKEVADTLGISVKTVEMHRLRIYSKLQLRSVGELVRYAVRNKIVEA